MRPYQNLSVAHGCRVLLTLCLIGTSVNIPAVAQRTASAKPASGAAATVESLTLSGFENYYNANYPDAIRDFGKVVETHPEDPRALNHLLAAVLFSELYRAGALNTTLYSGDSFLAQKKRVQLDPKQQERFKQLAQQVMQICDARLAKDPGDIEALYTRGVARGLQATYLAIVEKAWFSALRNAIGARHDHERVLELDPKFTDAKTVVGVHNYVAGSLPWAVKAAISIAGLSGSRQKGLEYLRTVAEAKTESSVDAKVALALFLRREQKYKEAIDVVHSLTSAYPHNFLFALEEANLLKDSGKNQEALEAYRRLLAQGEKGGYHEPRMEFPHYDLAEILRGRGEYEQAVENYLAAEKTEHASPELRQKAALNAGEMYDMLERRELAVNQYNVALNVDSASPLADSARRYLRQPYRP